jgi:hypothetical protein
MAYSKEPNKTLRRLLILTIVIWAIGAFPLFAKMAGFQFLPSVQWYQDSMRAAWGVGIFTGAFGALMIFRGGVRDEPGGMSLKSLVLTLFSPLFFGALGMHAVSVGFPILYTSVFGTYGEHQYVVQRAEGFSDRKCRNRIELRGNPFMYDQICGLSEEFRNALQPGMQLTVFGRSSHFGVIVAGARADQPQT